jgi:hypothetical protein
VTDGTRDYSSNEWCNIRIDQNVTLHRAFFDVERGFDWIALYAPGATVPASRPYSTPSFAWSDNGHPPIWVNASEGSRLIWSTASYFARGGFELCAVPHCAVPQPNTSRPPPSPPPCQPNAKACNVLAENFSWQGSWLFLAPLCVVMLIMYTIHLKQQHVRRKAHLQLRRRIASQARQISAPSRAHHAGRADALPARGMPVADATAVGVQMGVPVTARTVGLGVEPVTASVHIRQVDGALGRGPSARGRRGVPVRCARDDGARLSSIHGNRGQSVAISGGEECVELNFYGEPVFGIPVTVISGRSQDNQRQSPVYGQPVSAVSSAFAVPAPYATARSAASSASPTGITPGMPIAHATCTAVVRGFDSPHLPVNVLP